MLPIPLLIQFLKLRSCCAEYAWVRNRVNALVEHNGDLRTANQRPLDYKLNSANCCGCFDSFGGNGSVAVLEPEKHNFNSEDCVEYFASVDLISGVWLWMRCLLHQKSFYLDAREFFFVAVYRIILDALNIMFVPAL